MKLGARISCDGETCIKRMHTSCNRHSKFVIEISCFSTVNFACLFARLAPSLSAYWAAATCNQPGSMQQEETYQGVQKVQSWTFLPSWLLCRRAASGGEGAAVSWALTQSGFFISSTELSCPSTHPVRAHAGKS